MLDGSLYRAPLQGDLRQQTLNRRSGPWETLRGFEKLLRSKERVCVFTLGRAAAEARPGDLNGGNIRQHHASELRAKHQANANGDHGGQGRDCQSH